MGSASTGSQYHDTLLHTHQHAHPHTYTHTYTRTCIHTTTEDDGLLSTVRLDAIQ